MKVLFMGTPEFAVPSLNALVENNYEVVGAVTQRDKPKDRGHAFKAPPVKEYAVAHDIPVFQPQRLSKEPETVLQLKNLEPDLIVTCAFGQLLPESVLNIPRYGTVNVHGSLLPKYRGAAPIQWAVINGETKTGITTMLTDIGMDTGDMLIKDEIEIPVDMTAGELHDIMSLQGARTLLKTLEILKEGSFEPIRTRQDESRATYAPKIDKETGFIDWNQTSRAIHDRIRGTTPWPGAYTGLDAARIRIWGSSLADAFPSGGNSLPGTILTVDNTGMLVKTLDAALLIREIQADSSKRMTPRQYACGHVLKPGMILTSLCNEKGSNSI